MALRERARFEFDDAAGAVPDVRLASGVRVGARMTQVFVFGPGLFFLGFAIGVLYTTWAWKTPSVKAQVEKAFNDGWDGCKRFLALSKAATADRPTPQSTQVTLHEGAKPKRTTRRKS